jgi:4-diphosphocytidyl-2-C-methyl-D-erythritol kinase
MLTLKAPAKINWSLNVTGKRDDGYHNIESFMQCISLSDTLTFEHSDDIAIETEAQISLKQNLVYRAAKLLKKKTSTRYGANIGLLKRIPLEAGLGGGSSDAATTLRGLNTLWGLGLESKDLSEIGIEIGSDVPFFINGGAAFVKGRGDLVEMKDVSAEHHLVLVKPPFGVSAGWAYSNLEKGNSDIVGAEDMIKALNSRDFKLLGKLMKNDLEAPVLNEHSALGEIKNALIKSGAQAALMSGSGSTVFGVYEDHKTALKAMQGLGEKFGSDYLVVKVESIPS